MLSAFIGQPRLNNRMLGYLNRDHRYRYLTPYTRHQNQILEWLPSDSQECYQQNLLHRKQELQQHGWIDCHFTYTFNSHGFRCKEFSHDATVMFLGCSHTVGIGLPLHRIWPELVAQELGMHCANLGIGGSSLDTAFRLCYGYIDMIHPKIVVLMKPAAQRMELFMGFIQPPRQLGHWSDEPEAKSWISDERNAWVSETKNVIAIRSMCKDRAIRLIELDSTINQVDLARDLLHGGVKTNVMIAQTVLHLINQNAV